MAAEMRNKATRAHARRMSWKAPPLHSRKRSQITIFIIVAVVIVGIVLLFFFIKPDIGQFFEKPVTSNPDKFVEKCAQDAAYEAINIMLPQGGYLNPTNFKLYNNDKVQYLCYTSNYYSRCVNQEPMYIRHLEEEIKSYIKPIIEDCFYELKKELESQNYEVEMNDLLLDVNLGNDKVDIDMNRIVKTAKNGVEKRYEEFKSILKSPLYNLANVAIEIVNQEAKFCYFEYIGYMAFYPRFEIRKKNVGSMESASKVYLIKDTYSDKELNIAVRSCVMPPGM